MTAKKGRPTRTDEKSARNLTVRMTPHEYAQVHADALASGKSVSAYVRERLNAPTETQ